jgi:hypothetical protein
MLYFFVSLGVIMMRALPVAPTVCLSSYCTSSLLAWRNPSGLEDNWVERDDQPIPNYWLHCGKLITTEIGTALLCLTSLVETTAYFALTVCGIPLGCVSWKPLEKMHALFSSSSFTVWWNFGNVIVFNPIYKNVMTQESFARFATDHWPCGHVFRRISLAVGIVLCFFAHSVYPYLLAHDHVNSMRAEDKIYIWNWFRTHDMSPPLMIGEGEEPTLDEINDIISRMRDNALQTQVQVAPGIKFIEDEILAKVDATTRDEIFGYHEETLIFGIAKSIYIYAFGEKHNESIPTFFKSETIERITQLRAQFTQEQGAALSQRLESLANFKEEEKQPQTEEEKNLHLIFIRIREIAYKESQGTGIFMQACWPRACQEYAESHPEPQSAQVVAT